MARRSEASRKGSSSLPAIMARGPFAQPRAFRSVPFIEKKNDSGVFQRPSDKFSRARVVIEFVVLRLQSGDGRSGDKCFVGKALLAPTQQSAGGPNLFSGYHRNEDGQLLKKCYTMVQIASYGAK